MPTDTLPESSQPTGSSGTAAEPKRRSGRWILAIGLPIVTIVIGTAVLVLNLFTKPVGTKVVGGVTWSANPDAQITYDQHPTALPQQFPADFPVMAGLSISSTFHKIDGPLNTYTISWTTSADPAAVAGFYLQQLTTKGWQPEDVLNPDDTESIFFDYPVNGVIAPGPRSSIDIYTNEDTGLTGVDLTLNLPKSL